MITFNKNDKFQVLIQMKDPMSAQNAKLSLHGQNIYNGCCTLQIDFSKLTTLEVRFNNDKSRDYTNLLLPTGDGQTQPGNINSSMNDMGSQPGSMSSNNGQLNQQMSYQQQQQQQSLIGTPPNMYNNNGGPQMGSQMGNPNGFAPNQHNQPHMNQMHQMGGNPMHSQQQQQPNNYNMGMMPNQMGHNGMGHQNHSHNNQQNQSINSNNGINQGSSMATPVLLVSNLNEEFVTPEALFTLFGVYGDVLRVKILFNKKDSALINFSNGQQASTALANLDRAKLWSKQIRVFPSKHLTVQMPKDGQPDSGLTKDFSNSPLHRFKKPGSKNFNNIFPPSHTLHLSNIPPHVTEQELRDLFAMYGQVKAFKFFQKDRKMALLQMETVEEAVTALIATHNYQLADNMHLRCTFSKATI